VGALVILALGFPCCLIDDFPDLRARVRHSTSAPCV
jgi:hypothetical protein